MTQTQAEKKKRRKRTTSGKQKNRAQKRKPAERELSGKKKRPVVGKKSVNRKNGNSEKGTTSGKQRKKVSKKKKSARVSRKRRVQRVLIEVAGAVGVTGILIWLASLFLFSLVKVDGYGMLPTLGDGDTAFVSRQSTIRRFDLVALRTADSKEVSIRRVIGLPGESVLYKQDQLYINNEEKEELFIADKIEQANASNSYYTEDFTLYKLMKEHQIPSGKYLVLGDNRPYSSDSRYYGVVDKEAIIGVVKMRILPFHQMTKF